MLKFSCIIIIAGGLCFMACQNSSGELSETAGSQKQETEGPQLQKVAIENTAQADSLINMGLDVIVVEETYVVVRVAPAEAEKISSMNLKSQTVQESELVQRLVKIAISKKEDVQVLIELGMDVWEVQADTVTAQVFDKHIRQAESKGYTVKVVAKNVLDTVKK